MTTFEQLEKRVADGTATAQERSDYTFELIHQHNVPEDAQDIYCRLRAAKDSFDTRVAAGENPKSVTDELRRDAARGLPKRDAFDVMNAVDDMRDTMDPEAVWSVMWNQHAILPVWKEIYVRVCNRLGIKIKPLPMPTGYLSMIPMQQERVRMLGARH